MDMRKHIKYECELILIYAEDGAYHTAAARLATLTKVVTAHANNVNKRVERADKLAARKAHRK